MLDHPGGAVTFRYDNRTHVTGAVYASQQPQAVAVAGSLNAALGCTGDWLPACEQAQLTLDPATLVWKLLQEPPGRNVRVQSRAEPLMGRELRR